jgi:O-antigen ligase
MTAIANNALFTPRAAGFNWPDLRSGWAFGLVLMAAALTGPVGYLGQNAYAAVAGLAGIASLPFIGVRRAPMPSIAILLALALWAVVSMAWSVDLPIHPDFHRYKAVESLTAVKLVLELGLYGAFVFLAREAPPSRAGLVMAAMVIGLGVITAMMAIDAVSGAALHRALRLSAHAANKPEIVQRNAGRGCFTVALLFWPAAMWLRRTGRTPIAVLLALGLVIASVGLHVDSPVVALVLGGAVLYAVQTWGRAAAWTLMALTILYIALIPAFFIYTGPWLPHIHADQGVAKASWGIRLDIWRFTAGKIVQQPFRGWGVDASRVWDEIPLHPHNAALQLWFELGGVGAAIGAVFWGYVWARIGRLAEQDRRGAGVFAAVAVAYLSIGGLSFGVWQEWWLALGAIAVVICRIFYLAVADWPEGAEFEELQPLG